MVVRLASHNRVVGDIDGFVIGVPGLTGDVGPSWHPQARAVPILNHDPLPTFKR